MKFISAIISISLTPLVAMMPLEAEMRPLVSAVEGSVPGSTTPAQASALQIRLVNAGKEVVEANSFVEGFSVLVTDAAGLPVPEVAVAVRLPDEAVNAFFTDGAHSAVAYTNAGGLAKFSQVNWGPVAGKAAIRVTAAKGELHAGMLIEQTVVARAADAPQIERPGIQVAPPSARASSAPAARVNAMPGVPASTIAVHSGASEEQTPTPAVPTVSIVSTGSSRGSARGGSKKWILLAVIAAGAGVGAALALSGKGSASAAPATGISIGSPSISVGH